MSATGQIKRISVPEIAARKGGEPVSILTAYSISMARLLDPHTDCLLVGDSLGMVLYGMDSTLSVTLDMMIAHGAAVVRGSQRACVVVDLPWATYQESPQQAFRSAARVLAESGAQAVKLEGGEEMAETVGFLVRRGIPVMGHVGLTPQAVNALGGYRARGRSDAEQRKIIGDARAIADAGAFSIVVEGVIEPLARQITESVPAVTIGIGASAACDGQVLVTDDMLGLFSGFTPKFVKRYADIGDTISQAAEAYTAEVRARSFPGPEHVFPVKKN
ncbi:3-methyl-2-oxobutanoate hydroxymethyltransferase [Niveispirillum irakense]|uniref:3-methyl-2-oxobutanoate hydroxymethyltransferase n=1 Tax=Niveispirillum irakense TaxID=34011 RepID=UPI0003FA4B19|nr:3-methyl-2-oxobutanoate hydroxymethyltransferase [Niveispirillum irakense]